MLACWHAATINVEDGMGCGLEAQRQKNRRKKKKNNETGQIRYLLHINNNNENSSISLIQSHLCLYAISIVHPYGPKLLHVLKLIVSTSQLTFYYTFLTVNNNIIKIYFKYFWRAVPMAPVPLT
jgi:hypothetical protein